MIDVIVSKTHLCFVNLVAIAVSGLFIIPITLIFCLNWFNPPTSSFMIGYGISNYQNTINYEWKDWDEIAASAPLAVIAAEDQLFPKSSGFDFTQLKRILNQPQHGSRIHNSITQQTARNLFLWRKQSYLGKSLKAWLALLMDTSLDRQRILEIYLNIAEFSPGVYGIEAASQKFFFKPAHKLSNNESALLAAALANPDHFHVDSPSAFVEQRQRWIMDQMKALGQLASL